MRRLPTHFYLKRRRWAVVLTKARIYAPDGDEADGLCCPNTRTIEISARLGWRRRLEILMHELMHAVEFAYDVKIPHESVYALEKPLSMIFLLLKDLDDRTDGM